MYPLEYTCNPYWPASASSILKRPPASTSAPRSQRLLWISPFSSSASPASGWPPWVRIVPVIAVAASAPSGSGSAISQSARETERTVWIMLPPSSRRRAAGRLADEPRHQKGDDVSGELTVPHERWTVRPVPSEEALERLDLAVHRAGKEQRRRSDAVGVVAATAPARVEPLAAPDALGQRAKPALEDRLAGDDPRRDRHIAAERDQ